MGWCGGTSDAAIVDFSGDAEVLSHANLQSFIAGCSHCDGRFYASKATVGHENDGRVSPLLQVFSERQNVTLASPVSTNNPPYAQVSVPFGSPIGWEKPGSVIPAGSVVNSHYIWLNAPTAYLAHNVATFTFDGPILGIIGGPAELLATNQVLGLTGGGPGLPYVEYTPTATGFVNEPYPYNPTATGTCPCSGDIVIRRAPATLTVDFQSYAGDYVRVITAANAPLLTGDYDRDYDVDSSDYLVWRSLFGSNDPRADSNSDGSVDAADFVAWRNGFRPGDFDNDYDVDQNDYVVWRSAFSTNDLRADEDGNGIVTAADYVVWRKNLGKTYQLPASGAASDGGSAFGTAAPEPSSLLLAIACLPLGALARRRYRAA